MRLPNRLLPHRADYQPPIGGTATGANWSDPVSLRCRVRVGETTTRHGREVEVWDLTANMEALGAAVPAVGGLISYEGTDYRVGRVQAQYDPLGSLSHYKVWAIEGEQPS